MLVDVQHPEQEPAVIQSLIAFIFMFTCAANAVPHRSLARASVTNKQTANEKVSQNTWRLAGAVVAMVGIAYVAYRLNTWSTTNAPYLSTFVAQLSTLGIYVFGAPIWEPISSSFRKFAFDVHGEAPPADDQLEALWRRTQREYSINEQMSRNVITSFLVTAQMNFYQAHLAMGSRDADYAAEQIAEAAVRLRTYFADISPRDPAVTAAIRAAFTDFASVDDAFRAGVLAAVSRLDATNPNPEGTYGELLDAWLGGVRAANAAPSSSGGLRIAR